jgi:hypothetical protein
VYLNLELNILILIALNLFGPKRDEVTGGWRKREEHRLRRIFGPKRDEVTRE